MQSVTLSSTLMSRLSLDLPSLAAISLPNAFHTVSHSTLEGVSALQSSSLAVNDKLLDVVPFTKEAFEALDPSVSLLTMTDFSGNTPDFVHLNLSRLSGLEELTIGDNSFRYIREFEVDGLPHLRSLQIGANSFVDQTESAVHSFRVAHCISLYSIFIDLESFSNYGDVFVLKDLPVLNSFQVGSSVMKYASFQMKGTKSAFF